MKFLYSPLDAVHLCAAVCMASVCVVVAIGVVFSIPIPGFSGCSCLRGTVTCAVPGLPVETALLFILGVSNYLIVFYGLTNARLLRPRYKPGLAQAAVAQTLVSFGVLRYVVDPILVVSMICFMTVFGTVSMLFIIEEWRPRASCSPVKSKDVNSGTPLLSSC